VDLPGSNNGGVSTLRMYSTNSTTGLPSSLLASATIGISGNETGNVFDFGTGVLLSANVKYAMVLSNDGAGGGNYRWTYSTSSECYPLGAPATSTNSGSSWSSDLADFFFTTYMVPNNTIARLQDVPPKWVSAAQALPKVFVIAFPPKDPANTPNIDGQLLAQQVIARIREGSIYHGYANPLAMPSVEFQIYGGQIARHPTTAPLKADNLTWDWTAIYNDSRYGLCNKIANGLVDEVWFMEAGEGGNPEYLTTGPGGTWSSGGAAVDPLPSSCWNGRQVTTAVFNYRRDIDVAMEAYNHRLEGLYLQYFGCDFASSTVDDPYLSPPASCSSTATPNGYVARPTSASFDVGSCGHAHRPPNTVGATNRTYKELTKRLSICEDWRMDGTASASAIDCRAWNCNQPQFHVWWMQNLPGLNNTNRDRFGSIYPNWWDYLFRAPSPGT
jgi:hypothetical protein